MALQEDLTTLVCLFHHQENAQAALRSLVEAGVPEQSLTAIGGPGAQPDALEKSELASLGMPDKDYDHLREGVRSGGVVVAVANTADAASVERIFHKYSAEKIDEVDTTERDVAPFATGNTGAANVAIPIVEEELSVGKRTVDAGGVRVYRRVVETPVEESVKLREEHVSIDRRPVDRSATDADLAFGDRTIEVTETTEEAVVGKSARVVEEVVLGKSVTEHTETISDTVRRTEVDVEEVPPTSIESRPLGSQKR